MQTDIEEFFYKAEDHYLQPAEMTAFKHQVDSLGQRLELYKFLRDQEIAIFQPVADDLVKAFPDTQPQLLETAIKHWLCVMRYGAMAMLLNNPDYFQHRLLEWLTDIIQAHEMVIIEQHLYEQLENQLKKMLKEEKFELVQPFLTQAQATLLQQKIQDQPMTVGVEG